jgi:hypothetical protein
MPCPLFRRDGAGCRCAAVQTEVIPTLHERELFCTSAQASLCPTFQAHEAAGGPVSEATYLELWLAPPRKDFHTPADGVCT